MATMSAARQTRLEDNGGRTNEQVAFYDMKFPRAKAAVDVYNNTQLPPPPPDPSFTQIQRRNSKIRRVQEEEKNMSQRMEQRLQDISNIYRVAIPSMSDSYHNRSPVQSSVGRLPPLSPSGRMVSTSPQRIRPPQVSTHLELDKGSMFRATMAGRTRTSSSYREFVGRLSYLINQSQDKMTKLYGSSDLSLVMEFLGKESPDHCVYLDSSPSDKMAAFRQQQFCISSTVRKILNNEARKKRLALHPCK